MANNEQQPDTREPSDERKADLEAAYEQNLAVDKAPYAGVEIKTYGELQWIMQQRQWSGIYPLPPDMRSANLSGTNLAHTILSKVHLHGVNLSRADLFMTDLSGSELLGANLSNANLTLADINHADLTLADLDGAHLYQANLSSANLNQAKLISTDFTQTNLRGANLNQANLRGANLLLTKFDSDTNLTEIRLSSHTRFRDIRWNGVDLTSIDWTQLPYLGNDIAREDFPIEKARGNRQLATRLHEQGVSGHADRFAYRARVWERRATHRKGLRGFFPYLGSLFLDLIAGYGYRPERTLLAYILVILGFTIAFMQFGTINGHAFTFHEGMIFSLTSFHGRGFFPGGLSLDDPITTIAAGEAVIGLIIEVSFIATFTQRFFAR